MSHRYSGRAHFELRPVTHPDPARTAVGWTWQLVNRRGKPIAESRIYASMRGAKIAIRDVVNVWIAEAAKEPIQ